MDQLLIAGKTIEEHVMILNKVLETARQKCIKLRPSKCSMRVRVKEVIFIGHIITEKGIEPDNTKIKQ